MNVTIDLTGDAELIESLRQNGNLKRVLHDAFERIGEHARSASRERAPHDRGKLRNSIIYEQTPPDSDGVTTGVRIGTIGSDRPRYAAWMEFGTGKVNDHPSWPKNPHKMGAAAGEALAAWGRRTGKDAGAAFWAIVRRGGILPKRYLRSVLEENGDRYVNVVRVAVGRFNLG